MRVWPPESPFGADQAQHQNLAEETSRNVSRFVAGTIWLRRGVSPLRGRAQRLPRRKPLRGLLVPMDTIFDLLQTTRN